MLQIRRIYDPAGADDGARFLVDRLWPRGISKEAARIDRWLKDAAPSEVLRRQFHRSPERWDEFRRLYFEELDRRPEAWQPIVDATRHGNVTLLYAARNTETNNAVALLEYLRGKAPVDPVML